MPRSMAPPPSGEFTVVLSKPFSGTPTQQIEVIGEPNRPAVIRASQYNGSQKSSEKSGDVPADDVQELLSLVNQLRGFPSHNDKDVYGHDTKLDFNTFEIQWSNQEEDPSAGSISEIAPEQKTTFKDVSDSIEALSRTFAKKDSAV